MRKLFFISIVLLFSCTVKKKQHPVVSFETQQDTAVKKNYVYVDSTAVEETTVVYDSAVTVVQAPAEEDYTPAVTQAEDTIEVDTTVYRWQLTVAPDTVAVWKKMKQFAYVKNLDSLLKAAKEKKKEEVKQPERKRVRSSGGNWLGNILSSKGLQVFLWILAAAFVLFIIYKLFVTDGALKRRSKTLPDKIQQAEEEIITHESDFDGLIRLALEQRNYRLAVRYHYLQTLHALAQKNYVQLAADKTNYNYVREIADYNRQNDFAGLTLNYEYVWYGEFNIDEIVYQKIKTSFQSFNTKI